VSLHALLLAAIVAFVIASRYKEYHDACNRTILMMLATAALALKKLGKD